MRTKQHYASDLVENPPPLSQRHYESDLVETRSLSLSQRHYESDLAAWRHALGCPAASALPPPAALHFDADSDGPPAPPAAGYRGSSPVLDGPGAGGRAGGQGGGLLGSLLGDVQRLSRETAVGGSGGQDGAQVHRKPKILVPARP
jgi:hypothetical protein